MQSHLQFAITAEISLSNNFHLFSQNSSRIRPSFFTLDNYKLYGQQCRSRSESSKKKKLSSAIFIIIIRHTILFFPQTHYNPAQIQCERWESSQKEKKEESESFHLILVENDEIISQSFYIVWFHKQKLIVITARNCAVLRMRWKSKKSEKSLIVLCNAKSELNYQRIKKFNQLFLSALHLFPLLRLLRVSLKNNGNEKEEMKKKTWTFSHFFPMKRSCPSGTAKITRRVNVERLF